jgi:type VI secretion system secreted protein Hcp
MAVDAFLKIDEVKGESVAGGHEGEIDLLSWGWGLSQSGTMHRATGGGAGKVDVQDLVFTHFVDSATPNLMLYCSNGKHFTKAVLTAQKAGGKAMPYFTITMEQVIVTAVEPGSEPGDELVKETVKLNFSKFTVSYQHQDEKGAKKGGAIEAKYDIAKNV